MTQTTDLIKAIATILISGVIGFSIVGCVSTRRTMQAPAPSPAKTVTYKVASPWAINMAGDGRPTQIFKD